MIMIYLFEQDGRLMREIGPLDDNSNVEDIVSGVKQVDPSLSNCDYRVVPTTGPFNV